MYLSIHNNKRSQISSDKKKYNGGADSILLFDDNDNNPIKAGWVARRWDVSVAER